MKPAMAIVGVVAVVVIGITATQMRRTEYVATADETHEFELGCDFARFRQIMVRKNATEFVVNQGGMTLLDESLHGVSLDLSGDDRPILNAIRGASRSEIDARKVLTVKLRNAGIKVDKLVLAQRISVEPDELRVRTATVAPQEEVQDYTTTLHATAAGDKTLVQLRTKMEIKLQVPRLFTGRADRRVQSAAAEGLRGQEAAISKLVVEHAGKVIILPEFK